MNYGKRIREIRHQIGMSQERLGELVGFTQAHISMIENGERELNVKTADKIADALGVTLNELLVESEDA